MSACTLPNGIFIAVTLKGTGKSWAYMAYSSRPIWQAQKLHTANITHFHGFWAVKIHYKISWPTHPLQKSSCPMEYSLQSHSKALGSRGPIWHIVVGLYGRLKSCTRPISLTSMASGLLKSTTRYLGLPIPCRRAAV